MDFQTLGDTEVSGAERSSSSQTPGVTPLWPLWVVSMNRAEFSPIGAQWKGRQLQSVSQIAPGTSV